MVTNPGAILTRPPFSKATVAGPPASTTTRFKMMRGQFLRVSAFSLPDLHKAPDLSTLALMGVPLFVVDGWLLYHVRAGKRMRMIVLIYEGRTCRKRFTSSRILRVKNGYILTKETLYQLMRVPPPEGETFAEFA